MNERPQDTLTSDYEPDVAALQEEYQKACNDGFWGEESKLGFAEKVRYSRAAGQTLDGLQHGEFYEEAGRSVVWEGFPDCRIFLADDICNTLVALYVMAFWNSKINVSPIIGKAMNAAEAGELRTILLWLKNGVLKKKLLVNVEIAAQLTSMLGWCVLHPGWKNEKVVVQQKVTMQDVNTLAQKFRAMAAGKQQVPGVFSLLSILPELVNNPMSDDETAEIFQMFFPETTLSEARKHIKALREKGETEFAQIRETSIGPVLGVLCPWYHFFMPIEATARPEDARVKFVVMRIPKWKLREWAEQEEWTDQAFIDGVENQAGQFQMPPRTKETDRDINMNLCEVVYAYRTVFKNGALSHWCTVFHPTVTGNKQDMKAGWYGKNWELNLEPGQEPFIFSRLEATDWAITETRGVCDVVCTYQNEKKNFRDAAYAWTQLNVTPPIQKMGTQATSLPPEMGPFGILNSPGGMDQWKPLLLTEGGNIEVPFKHQEVVTKEAQDYYGIPRGDTPPTLSQLKSQKLVNQWLGSLGLAMDQLAILLYQNMEPAELESILGHPPLLDARKVARHQVTVSYDVRTGDPDFIGLLKETLMGIMSAGLGNDLLVNKVLEYWMNFVDPNAAAEFLNPDSTGNRQAMKDARDELNNVMLGNAPMLVEKDPAAQTKLKYIQELVAKNPRYQRILTPKIQGQANPDHDPNVADNFKTMIENLQHSVQETVLSKAQGRLGVKNVGQG